MDSPRLPDSSPQSHWVSEGPTCLFENSASPSRFARSPDPSRDGDSPQFCRRGSGPIPARSALTERSSLLPSALQVAPLVRSGDCMWSGAVKWQHRATPLHLSHLTALPRGLHPPPSELKCADSSEDGGEKKKSAGRLI